MSDSTFIKPDRETRQDTKQEITSLPLSAFFIRNEKDIPCVDSLLNSPSPGQAPLGLYYHVLCVGDVTFVTSCLH